MKLASGPLGERVLILIGVVWGITAVTGLVLLFDYQTAPSASGNPAAIWPTHSRIVPAADRARVVMVAHPRCPCTRASVEALARIMAQSQELANASVLFLKPKGMPVGWEQTDLWHSAAAIPGVRVVCDEEGLEAARFGLESSGHVLLYDRNGQRLFSGGITAGRGHHGDNAGLDHCIALINGKPTEQRDTQVFGCSLFDSAIIREIEGENPCRKTN